MGLMANRRERELEEWIAEGIITPQQADRIRARRSGRSGPGAFALLASIGGACVALGVILVIAYNWDWFHRGWKLAGFLISLAAVAELSRRLPDRLAMARRATEVGWLLLPLAGIGMIGQVYHLSGDPLKPVLVALALSAPVAWCARNTIATLIHVAGLAAACWIGALNRNTWLSLVESRADGIPAFSGTFGLPVIGLAVLWSVAVFQTRRRLPATALRWLFLSLLAFLWALALFNTPFELGDYTAQYLLVGALSASFWAARGPLGLADDTTAEWGVLLTYLVLFAATFLWHSRGRDLPGDLDPGGLAYVGTIAAGSFVGTLLGRPDAFGRTLISARISQGLILSPMLLGVALLGGLGLKPAAVIANVLVLGVAVWELAEGVAGGRPGRVTFGILMLGLLIVTRFLDYFGTMLQSGMAFIVTGSAFIALAWVLHKGRTALLDRMKEPTR